MAYNNQCKICRKEFWVKKYRQNTAQFCSYKCHYKSMEKPQIEKDCQNCHKLFSVVQNRKESARYCSKQCSGKVQVSRMFNERAVQKMTDRIRGQYQNGRVSWNKGKIGVGTGGHLKGKKSPFWKGGTSKLWQQIINSVEYKVWRREVYLRDGFQCVQCGSEELIEADHIKAKSVIVRDFLTRHPELENNNEKVEAIKKFCPELWSIENGRTLCRECHSKTDNYGKKAMQQLVSSHNITAKIWQHQ